MTLVLFSDLIVDEYFTEICQESKTDEVTFHESVTWKEYHVTEGKSHEKEKQIEYHGEYHITLSYYWETLVKDQGL